MIVHNSIKEYLDINPHYYRFLKTINLSRKLSQAKSYGYNVELVLSKCSDDSDEDLRIQCVNASDIKIHDIDGMLGLLVDIKDISGRQLESCNYHITEQEEDAFSLNCEEFFVELIKN